MIFTGSATALITPFNPDFSINDAKFIELIERQIEGGTQALVINGTTGESATLSEQERLHCLKLAIKTVNRRVPVIAGTGSNNTQTAVSATQIAAESGADAAMLVTPYYNKTSQAGLIAHYRYIAQRTKLPLILYSVPGRTSQPMSVDTVLELAKEPNIIGLKDATGDITYAMELVQRLNNNEFALYSGNDDLVLPYYAIGAHGVISTVANLFPAPFQALCAAAEKGDWQTAKQQQYALLPIIKQVFSEPNPIGTKGGLNALGLHVGMPRLPLVEMGSTTYQNLLNAIQHFNENNKAVL